MRKCFFCGFRQNTMPFICIYFSDLVCYTFLTMVKTAPLHIVLTIMFISLGLAMPLLPAEYAAYAAMLCPALFSTLLCSVLCGTLCAMITGAAVPVLTWLLYEETGFLPNALAMTLALTAAGLAAGIFYRQLTTSIGAALSGILAFGIVLTVTKVILYFRAGNYYTADDFLAEVVIGIWPGLLACVLGIPLLTALFRKLGIMRVLRHEKYER